MNAHASAASERSPAPHEPEPFRPRVIVEILFERGVLSVAVRNIGARPAHDVGVQFEKALRGLGGTRDVGAQALFRQLAFLGPGRELATLLDSAAAYFARGEPTIVTARIEYRDADGNRYVETIRHDLAVYRDLVFVVDAAAVRADPDVPWSTR